MPPKFITTDGGEELVILARHEYEDLLARRRDAGTATVDPDPREDSVKPIPAERRARSTDAWSIERRLALGHRIAVARKAAGIDRRALARKAGLNLPELSVIERGIDACSFGTLARLAEVLGLEYDALWG